MTPFRYLFTCGCGLIDTRHFYQLMYIALLRGNAAAAEMGREHESGGQTTSKFAPEDMPSNAHGRALRRAAKLEEDQATFVSNLRTFLQLCGPVDFKALPPAEQDAIVAFYSGQTGDAPSNPNETATPSFPAIASCTGSTAFPFAIESTDASGKTLSRPEEGTP